MICTTRSAVVLSAIKFVIRLQANRSILTPLILPCTSPNLLLTMFLVSYSIVTGAIRYIAVALQPQALRGTCYRMCISVTWENVVFRQLCIFSAFCCTSKVRSPAYLAVVLSLPDSLWQGKSVIVSLLSVVSDVEAVLQACHQATTISFSNCPRVEPIKVVLCTFNFEVEGQKQT